MKVKRRRPVLAMQWRARSYLNRSLVSPKYWFFTGIR